MEADKQIEGPGAVKFPLSISALLLASLGGSLYAEQGRAIVSVLSPLAYGPNCWSTVALQNLGTKEVAVKVEGHKGSGALVLLAGWPSLSLIVSPAQKISLRLEVPGEESPEGWVRVSEATDADQSPMIAVSGQTECVDNDQLTTTSQTVAFPTRDPWLDAEVKDLRGQTVMILNTANKAAAANVCYSSGITAGLPREKGTGGDSVSVCAKTLRLQIPPFGTVTLPVVHEGSSEFSIKTFGESMVLRMLLPQSGAMKTYKVDSSVTFEQPAESGTR